jgi:hypothetical protein
MSRLVAVILLALSSIPLVQANQDLKGIGLGGTIGTFTPTGGRLRDAFGADRFTIGFRPVAPKEFAARWLPDFGVDAISAERRDNRLFILPVTFGVVRRFGSPGGLIRPYVRVGAGFAYMDYAFDSGNRRIAAKRFGPTGNVEVGVRITDRVRLAAAYHVFPRYDETTFDGIELSLTYTVFKF